MVTQAIEAGARHKLARDISTTFGTQVALVAVSLACSIVLARVLGPAGRGVYATVVTIGEVAVVIGALGISKAAVYFVASGSLDDGRLRRHAFWFALVNGLLISAALVAIALTVAEGWFPGIPRAALLAIVPFGVFALLRGVWESFLRGEQRIATLNAVAVCFSICFLIVVLALALSGDLSATAAIAARVCVAGAVVVALLCLVRRARSGIGWPRFDRETTRTLVAYGIPFGVVAIVQTASYRLDILFLQGLEGSTAVGTYSIAVGTGELLRYLPFAIGFVLLPRVAASRDSARAASETAKLARWTVLLTTLGALVLGAVAVPLIPIVYGEAFAGAVAPLGILLVGLVASVWYQVLSGYLSGRGHIRALLGATLVGLALNVSLNLVLIPRLGIAGAAAASAVSYTVTGLLALRLFGRVSPGLTAQAILPRPAEIRSELSLLRQRFAA